MFRSISLSYKFLDQSLQINQLFVRILKFCIRNGVIVMRLLLNRRFIKRIAYLLLPLLLVAIIDTNPRSVKAEEFESWLNSFYDEALLKGISPETLNNALHDLEPIPRVIELDRSQPEGTLTFEQYMERVVPSSRVLTARKLLIKNTELLKLVQSVYNVQPRFIVALWGIETNFGKHTGGFPVIASLATLAHDGRRSTYFRKELLNALRIIDEGHIASSNMMGSWAGAMGQSQFMPSSFINFAVDFDGDGRKDIWQTKIEVFASASNYLSRSGWNGSEIWGRQVLVPKGFDSKLANLKIEKSLQQWRALGIKKADGSSLPQVVGMRASIIYPGGEHGPSYLVYNNFRTILKWNRSTYFAMAVGLLADRIVGD